MNDVEQSCVPGTELEVRPAGEVEHVGEVLDAELVDESSKSLVQRWAQHPKVPVVLKPIALVPDAKPARRDLAVRVVRAPLTTVPRSILRGSVAAARLWWHWIILHEERESARKDNKLHEKGPGLRQTSLRRWKGTGFAVLGLVVLSLLLRFVFPGTAPLVLWPGLAAAAIALMILGRAKDGQPGRKPKIGGRAFGWTMDPEVLNDAYRDAKLIKKDEQLRLVRHAHFDGKGWHIVFDLPPTVKASTVVQNVEAVASALALDEINLSIERVRGDDGHAGRVSQWACPKDPFGGARPPLPLLKAERWNCWKPAPFGLDARDRVVRLSLVWSNLLVGAMPGKGKTFAARVASAPFVLDPHVEAYCFNGKGDKTWKAAEQFAYRYGRGSSDEKCIELRDILAGLKAKVEACFDAMDEMDDDECPDGKVTEDMSRGGRWPVSIVIIDELQNYTECGADGWRMYGKKATVGQNIGGLLTWLAKNGRAAALILVLSTQRPDALSLPTALRAQIGHRFALKVMSWLDSNIILGDKMNTSGYDSSALLESHLGVGILRPDGELATVDAGFPTVSTFGMSGRDWTDLCQRGRQLRIEAKTLRGHAAGEDMPVDLAAVQRAAAEAENEPDEGQVLDAEVVDYGYLPSPLREVVEYLAEDLDDDGRPFVPTSELAEELDLSGAKLANDLRVEPICLFPKPNRLDGERKQIRGYRMGDIRAAISRCHGEDGGADVIDFAR